MFWHKKKTEYTVNAILNPAAGNQLARITFNGLVYVKYLNVRQIPTGGNIYIMGDEYGPRLTINEINAIYILDVVNEIGTPNVLQIINAVQMNAANNLMYFSKGWLTRNLYVQNQLTGQHIFTAVYEIY